MNKDQLLQIVQRIEKLNQDMANITADIKEIYHEATSQGFDAKAIRKCVALRKKAPEELSEEEAILQLYREALNI